MELSPAVWPRLSKLLDEALDMTPDARQEWLEQLATTQPELAPSLRELLAAHASSETADVMARLPPLSVPAQTVRTAVLAAGDRVGPYRLKRELGAGGMADVWLAERADGAFARDVALKLPLITRLRRDLAQRFARERDILARLEHPNIARLYDAGVTEDGLPYLAMEYVDGQPIIEYCDQHQLDIDSRLKLFTHVLDAVQFAHANLIIHRDLKPSNILVTADAQVRLLDFGIAKLLADDETARETQLTQLSGRAMTPDYASPEQIKGEPLTIATDVYSLGVVLYQLLAGQRPYKLGVQSAAHLEQAIVETEPKRPSSVVDAAAAQVRGTSSTRLAKTLSGDLDTIVLKALAKAPQQRYATVAGFAADLKRYLDGQPVTARPAGWTYRVRKFVARNKLAVGAAATTALALIAGTGIAVWQTHEARTDQRRAEQVKAFLASIFADIDPATGQGRRVPASAILLNASKRVDAEFGAEPRLALEVATLITDGLAQEEGSEASTFIEAALQRYASSLSPSDPIVLKARVSRLRPHAYAGTFPKVAATLPELIEKLRVAEPPLTRELVYTLGVLSASEVYAGRMPSAVAAAAEAAQLAENQLGFQDPDTITAFFHWSNQLMGAGRLAEAETAADKGLAAARALYKRPHVIISSQARVKALVLMRIDRPREAAELLNEVLEDRMIVYGADSRAVAETEYFLGQALAYAGQFSSALQHLQAGQQALLRFNPEDHRNHWVALSNVGYAYQGARMPQKALRLLDEAEQTGRANGVKVEQSRGPQLSRCIGLARLGRFADADALCKSLLAVQPPLTTPEHWRLHRGMALLARLEGRPADAAALVTNLLGTSETASVTNADRAAVRSEQGLALLENGDVAAAASALKLSRAEFEKAQIDSGPDLMDVYLGLARVALLQGDKPEAVALLNVASEFWGGFDPGAIDASVVEYWRARADGRSPSPQILTALRSSPYPLHRNWLAN